jgi:hypothetical protein
MNNKQYVIIGLIIFLILLFLYDKKENITTESGKTLSDEALQYIASVYNTQELIVTNLTATNNIKAVNINSNVIGNVTGNVTGNITGNVTGNVTGDTKGNLLSPNGKYKLSIDDDGKLHVKNNDNIDINITPATGTGFKGKLISLDETTYFLSNPTSGGSGLIIGYDVNATGTPDTDISQYKFARKGG